MPDTLAELEAVLAAERRGETRSLRDSDDGDGAAVLTAYKGLRLRIMCYREQPER